MWALSAHTAQTGRQPDAGFVKKKLNDQKALCFITRNEFNMSEVFLHYMT